MVIRINWYSREGPRCRIADQVDRFAPFASFYRYATAYGTCWLRVIFAQCTVACCSQVIFPGAVPISGVTDNYITVVFCHVLASDYSISVRVSALLASGSFNTVVCCGGLAWECYSTLFFSDILTPCCYSIAVFSGILSSLHASSINCIDLCLFQKCSLIYSLLVICKKRCIVRIVMSVDWITPGVSWIIYKQNAWPVEASSQYRIHYSNLQSFITTLLSGYADFISYSLRC
jgi:hypothetical protein